MSHTLNWKNMIVLQQSCPKLHHVGRPIGANEELRPQINGVFDF